MFLLLDSNITAGYYLPRSLNSIKARERIEIIFKSIRSGGSDHFLYIPNFCIAEVFSVFMKHAFGTWNPHVGKKRTIDKRIYESLVKQFHKDIHNGKFIYHLELNRYHILGINLVAPIDHYYRISRGIALSHIHGRDNVCIISSDDRLTAILAKCKATIPDRTVKRLKLDIAKEVTGKPFSSDLFPRYLNLKTARKVELENIFGIWPLEVGVVPEHYRWIKC
jgi:hypothetical protein